MWGQIINFVRVKPREERQYREGCFLREDGWDVLLVVDESGGGVRHVLGRTIRNDVAQHEGPERRSTFRQQTVEVQNRHFAATRYQSLPRYVCQWNSSLKFQIGKVFERWVGDISKTRVDEENLFQSRSGELSRSDGFGRREEVGQA